MLKLFSQTLNLVDAIHRCACVRSLTTQNSLRRERNKNMLKFYAKLLLWARARDYSWKSVPEILVHCVMSIQHPTSEKSQEYDFAIFLLLIGNAQWLICFEFLHTKMKLNVQPTLDKTQATKQPLQINSVYQLHLEGEIKNRFFFLCKFYCTDTQSIVAYWPKIYICSMFRAAFIIISKHFFINNFVIYFDTSSSNVYFASVLVSILHTCESR